MSVIVSAAQMTVYRYPLVMHDKDTEPWNPDSPDGRWDRPSDSDNDTDIRSRQAAATLWLLSIVELVLFGLCSAVTIMLGVMSPEKLRALAPEENANSAQLQTLLDHQSELVPAAILLIIVMVVPAIVMIILGFGVRQGGGISNKAARIIIYIQCFAMAMELFWGITTGGGSSVIVSAVIFGGMLALLIYTVRKLLGARDAQIAVEQDS